MPRIFRQTQYMNMYNMMKRECEVCIFFKDGGGVMGINEALLEETV